MSDPLVKRYLFIADNSGHPPNLNIVDPVTEDYVPALTPREREDAVDEVSIMLGSTDWSDWENRSVLVASLRQLRHRIWALEDALAATSGGEV